MQERRAVTARLGIRVDKFASHVNDQRFRSSGDSQLQHVSTTLTYTSSASLAEDFHVYEARWTPTQVDFYVDGTPCGTISTAKMQTFGPQQLLVGMAVGGAWPGDPDATTPSPADMRVDWVQVIQ